MKSPSKSAITLVLAVSTFAGVAFMAPALSARPAPAPLAPPAAVIATVDLEKAITQLTERGVRESELKGFADSLQSELSKLGAEITDLNNKMNTMDAAEKKAGAPKLLEMQFNAKVKKELYEALIDQRRGEIFRALYEKLTDASKRLAQRNGYTMVLSSDMGVKVPNGPSNEIERTITLKRFLYLAPEHDVTNELIAMMNNEWAAGGSTAPAPR